MRRVRIGDVAEVVDSQQDLRNAGLVNGRSVSMVLFRQPGPTSSKRTTDRVNALLPGLSAAIPGAIDLKVVMDRTPTIRSALLGRTHADDFGGAGRARGFPLLRDVRAALIPSVVVPAMLIGTFAVMHLAGFSLNALADGAHHRHRACRR